MADELNEQLIPLSHVLAPEWNSRLKAAADGDEEMASFAATLESEGQLQAIEVEALDDAPDRPDGVKGQLYRLVMGSRRVQAARQLGWSKIRANVRKPSTLAEKVVRNTIENEQRKPLTTFERANAYAKLKEQGWTQDRIGKTLGNTKGNVSNYLACLERLPDFILADWQAEHPAATIPFLRQLAGYREATPAETTEHQRQAWNAAVKKRDKADQITAVLSPEDEEEAIKEKAKAKREREKAAKVAALNAPYEVTRGHYAAIVEGLKGLKGTVDRKWVLKFLDFTCGITDKVPAGIEVTDPDEVDEQLEAAE